MIENPFLFCPQCGSPGGEFLRHHEYRCSVCGHRYFHNVAAAAGILARDVEGRFLFLRRGMEPARGLLGLPGGFVDPGEGVTEAVKREVREELGAEISSPVFLDGYPNRYAFSKIWYHTLDLYFTADILTPQAQWTLDAQEVVGLVWMLPEQVDETELAFQSLRQMWHDWKAGRWEVKQANRKLTR
ncbi:MAG: NUDIX hydrolase [Spirochaetales bacterium]|nr:NUDIX hydrolase [Spirochaetales bacterium]